MKILIFLLSITVAQAQVKSWYHDTSKFGQLTQQTIDQLKTISPEIFASLDTLSIPVYVKIMDEKDFKQGASGLTTIEKDCIFIRIVYSTRSTRVLAHEFGHAIYQIKNPEYVNFYIKRYSDRKPGSQLGHDGDDESGKVAFLFEQQHVNNMRANKTRFGSL